MRLLDRLTLAQQFLVASLPIAVGGMLVIGVWVQREVERGIVTRIAEVQSLYVDSIVAPHVTARLAGERIEGREKAALDTLFVDTPLGRRIVAFLLWRDDGRILYSNEAQLIGREVKVGAGLRTALAGDVYAKVIDRSEQPHPYATAKWPQRLIEVYAPIRAHPDGPVLGAAEFYQTTAELDAAMHAARVRSWGVVAATTALTYLLLFALVRRGSRTIGAQRRELDVRVRELTTLAEANGVLAAQVRRAAARTVAQNEQFLRSVASDLHDGPAQDMGFARMRIASLVQGAPDTGTVSVPRAEVAAVDTALELAMRDLRAICEGLQLPDLDTLDANDVAARVVRDYERKSGATVTLECASPGCDVALPVRITLFRVLQEMLANGFRHAGAAGQSVRLACADGVLSIQVRDRGPGFDPAQVAGRADGGLAGIRERVRALGGTFDIESAPGQGTRLRVALPMQLAEGRDD